MPYTFKLAVERNMGLLLKDFRVAQFALDVAQWRRHAILFHCQKLPKAEWGTRQSGGSERPHPVS